MSHMSAPKKTSEKPYAAREDGLVSLPDMLLSEAENDAAGFAGPCAMEYWLTGTALARSTAPRSWCSRVAWAGCDARRHRDMPRQSQYEWRPPESLHRTALVVALPLGQIHLHRPAGTNNGLRARRSTWALVSLLSRITITRRATREGRRRSCRCFLLKRGQPSRTPLSPLTTHKQATASRSTRPTHQAPESTSPSSQ
jgi:hypothetical protein